MKTGELYKHYKPGVTPPGGYDGPCMWFLFHSGKLLVNIRGDAAEVPLIREPGETGVMPVRSMFIGFLGEEPCYCAGEYPGSDDLAPVPREGFEFREFRSLFSQLPDDIFMLAGRAMQLTHWDRNSRFCGKCGSPTSDKGDERAKLCPECGLVAYPRISPAVITAILRDDKILLAHARHFRGNMYSLIAGFVEPGETLEDCVKREIKEEVGLEVGNVRYFASQPWPFPDSLMIGFIAEYAGGEIKADGVEISDAGWYDRSSLPELPTGISIARRIIDWYIRRD